MKISKLFAICGVMLVSAMSTGCLKGPVANGEFSMFPGGVYFENGQQRSND